MNTLCNLYMFYIKNVYVNGSILCCIFESILQAENKAFFTTDILIV